MDSLTRGAEPTVPLDEVLADVKLGAGGAELAGAMLALAFVVMSAYLHGYKKDFIQKCVVFSTQQQLDFAPGAATAAGETYLRKQSGIVLQQQLEQMFFRKVLKTDSLQNLCIVRSCQTVVFFTLESKK